MHAMMNPMMHPVMSPMGMGYHPGMGMGMMGVHGGMMARPTPRVQIHHVHDGDAAYLAPDDEYDEPVPNGPNEDTLGEEAHDVDAIEDDLKRLEQTEQQHQRLRNNYKHNHPHHMDTDLNQALPEADTSQSQPQPRPRLRHHRRSH